MYIVDNQFVIRSTLLRKAVEDPSTASWMMCGGNMRATENMQLGSVAHMLLLQPELFGSRYVVHSGRRGTSEYARLVEEYGAEFVVKEDMYQTALAMADTARKFLESGRCEERLKTLFANGFKERVLKYFDEDSGCVLQITPDCYDKTCFMDYKTTSLPYTNVHVWRAHVRKYNSSLQLGYYSFVFAKLGMPMTEGAYHLVQSTVPPYCIRCFFFDYRNLESTYSKVHDSLGTVLSLQGEIEECSAKTFDLCDHCDDFEDF